MEPQSVHNDAKHKAFVCYFLEKKLFFQETPFFSNLTRKSPTVINRYCDRLEFLLR